MEPNFFNDTVRFVKQSYTTDLKTRGYSREFNGLDVKFGFGMGNPTHVPWISFTGFKQNVQSGIYPVFLYYKRVELLILSYGVSATNKPELEWDFADQTPPRIDEYFAQNGLGKPEKFGESFVYRVYEINKTSYNVGLDEDSVTSDLRALTGHYKSMFNNLPGEAMPISNFFDAIKKFVVQSNEKNIPTPGYPKQYDDLEVKVSFEFENQAGVPWMALLGYGQQIANGIYPIFRYYKDRNLLILCYLESKPYSPMTWIFAGETPQTVSEYFDSEDTGESQNIDTCYIHSSYQTDMEKNDYGLNSTDVMRNLLHIVTVYRSQFEGNKNSHWIDEFVKDATAANFMINGELTLRYVASLMTKPFVILTGLSGSGKTKLALLFAQWICESSSQYKLVPVGADWTNREPLLGYPNALDSNSYVKPDSGVLNIIVEAAKPSNQNKPYFLIMDEMNMSHVERYFADFLSAMESDQEIYLHPKDHDISGVPPKIKLSKNLFIVGTVNIDETTYMFSPKVLDRANVIEFRVASKDMNRYLTAQNGNAISLESGIGKQFANQLMDFATRAYDKKSFSRESLISFFDELEKIGAEFGYRSAYEVNRFCCIISEIGVKISENQIMDFAIMQKLLPKVHGSRRKLEPVLRKLMELCFEDPSGLEDLLTKKKDLDSYDAAIRYPVSLRKILRMFWNMTDNGFTSYSEA